MFAIRRETRELGVGRTQVGQQHVESFTRLRELRGQCLLVRGDCGVHGCS
jgi:hypothetical protein